MVVATPFSKNNVTAGARWYVTACCNGAGAHIGGHIWVGTEVTRYTQPFNTEWFGFKISPGQGAIRIINKTRSGDVVNQFLCIAEVRTVGNIPREVSLAGAHGSGWPVGYGIVRGCTAAPCLTVETTNVGGVFDFLTATVVSNHAHKVVPMGILSAGGNIIGERFVTFAAGRVVWLNFDTAVLLARRRAFDITMAKRHAGKT